MQRGQFLGVRAGTRRKEKKKRKENIPVKNKLTKIT
jgi:hypothetical protein